jgi:DNA polymerase-3 subunit gamma/tau
MGQALYRKYRPKSLAEVVGQEHITSALNNALKQGRISHAYLFTGPHGTGKTSIARILAYQINQLPYDESNLPIDIIEIDAASNRRIDEIRDLRDKVHIAPTSAKFKVYIIDEVHMLTKEAFNALLKTLEEPPAHVIFILATTEAHKLPETIISRTQRYVFKPIKNQEVAAALGTIAQQESIKISPSALDLIAAHGNGSFRDSISLLDQVSNFDKAVGANDILSLLGVAPAEAIEHLTSTLLNGTPKDIIGELSRLRNQGYEAASIAKQLGQSLRTEIINAHPASPAITDLLGRLLEVPSAHNHEATLEISLLGFNLRQNPSTQTQSASPPKATIAEPIASIAKPAKPSKKPTEPKPSEPRLKLATTASATDFWPQALDAIKQRYNTLYGVLRMAQPSLQDQTLTLQFKFPFHQKRVKESKNQQIISDVIQQHLGHPVTIVCTLDESADAPTTTVSVQLESDTNPLATISNIFGSAEVLES